MKELREMVESLLGEKFEIAMCLFYPDGEFFAPYHSDQETSGSRTILPSISLGAVRDFIFKHKTHADTHSLELAHGSMLVMGNYCQSRYEHSLPKTERCKDGRINITFRERNFQ